MLSVVIAETLPWMPWINEYSQYGQDDHQPRPRSQVMQQSKRNRGRKNQEIRAPVFLDLESDIADSRLESLAAAKSRDQLERQVCSADQQRKRSNRSPQPKPGIVT